MRTLAMLVMAGEADSTGNGRRGALGKGSGSGAIAVAAAAWPLLRGAADSREGWGCCGGGCAFGLAGSDALARGVSTGDEGGIASEAALAGAGCFGFLGLSHRSQRIPRVIAAPHIKHFEAMGQALFRDLTPATYRAAR
jgi:hypothetical protein